MVSNLVSNAGCRPCECQRFLVRLLILSNMQSQSALAITCRRHGVEFRDLARRQVFLN